MNEKHLIDACFADPSNCLAWWSLADFYADRGCESTAEYIKWNLRLYRENTELLCKRIEESILITSNRFDGKEMWRLPDYQGLFDAFGRM